MRAHKAGWPLPCSSGGCSGPGARVKWLDTRGISPAMCECVEWLLHPDPCKRWGLEQLLACELVDEPLLHATARQYPEYKEDMHTLRVRSAANPQNQVINLSDNFTQICYTVLCLCVEPTLTKKSLRGGGKGGGRPSSLEDMHKLRVRGADVGHEVYALQG